MIILFFYAFTFFTISVGVLLQLSVFFNVFEYNCFTIMYNEMVFV